MLSMHIMRLLLDTFVQGSKRDMMKLVDEYYQGTFTPFGTKVVFNLPYIITLVS